MSGDPAAGYTFTFPECDEHLEVNESMKRAIEDQGCVICGARVTGTAFSERPSTDLA